MRLYFVCAVLFVVATFITPIPRLELAVFELLILAGLYFAYRKSAKKRRAAIQRYIDDVTDDMTTADKASMLSAPVAMMVFRPDTQEILWINEAFRQLTGVKENIFESLLDTTLPSFSFQWLLEGKNEAPGSVVVNDHSFRVFGTLSRPDGVRRSTLLATTYWFDTTELEGLRTKIERDRPVVGKVMVDNYDELMKAGTEATRSALLARINEKLNAWFENTGSLFCRLDRNQYLFVCTLEIYETFAQGKFSVLDTVREVVTEDGVAATLSIGIGKDAGDFSTLYQYASLSIEMALSRGGDQVVVRNNLDFEFYGGKSQASEKRTKVKSRVMANSLSELMRAADGIFIMGHKQADLDSVGSAVGLVCAARALGKKARIVIDMETNVSKALIDRMLTLPEYKDVFISPQDAILEIGGGALLIIVDTNRPEQVESEPLLLSCNRVAVIDHHRRAATYIQNAALQLHEPYASSASELVTELLEYMVDQADILRYEAEALLSGIVLDTKNFTLRTGGRTFDAAAFLRRAGADTTEVKYLLQSDIKSAMARYAIVQKAKVYKAGIAIAAPESAESKVIAAQAADELLNISGIQASFVVFPMGEEVDISARSIGDINVQLILEKLGGGGNKSTAGAQITGRSQKEVVHDLLVAIDQYLDDNSLTE